MYVLFFFLEYIWIFFFSFLSPFFFCLLLFSLKRKFQVRREKGALVCLGEERGMRRSEQMSVGRKRRDGGLEYLSLFSRSRSFALPGRDASLCLEALCVKLLLLVRFLVGDGGLLGLLQRVAALVLFLHPVDQQHHQEGREQGAHHSPHDHR